MPEETTPSTDQPSSQPPHSTAESDNSNQSATHQANYIPASPEFLAELEQAKSQPAPSSPNQTSPTFDQHQINDSSNEPQSPASSTTPTPDTTPLANQDDLGLPPLDQIASQDTSATVTQSTRGASFRPPQEVIDNLSDDQKKFINGASWAGAWGLIFLIAQNSLKHSLIAYIGSAIPIINIGVFIYYVKFGRKIAWESHYWDSFESYQHNMGRWSKWAKLYVIVIGLAVLGLLASVILIAINPQDRVNEANDTAIKSTVSQVAFNTESCFIQEKTNNYQNCDSLTKLAQGSYLTQKQIQAFNNVTIVSDPIAFDIIIYAQLKAKSVFCHEGSGKPAYYVYSSATGQYTTVCGKKPSLSSSTAKTSPTPVKTTVTPTKATPLPSINFSR